MTADNAKATLSPQHIKALFSYEPDTGFVRWNYRPDGPLNWNTKFAGTVAGSLGKDNKIRIGIKGSHYLAHRIAWVVMTGDWPTDEIDHENLDTADNRWTNLRPASSAQNNRNRRRMKRNSSGFKGVNLHVQSGKWWARITINRKTLSLGLYNTPQEAHEAYKSASVEYHQKYGRDQ